MNPYVVVEENSGTIRVTGPGMAPTAFGTKIGAQVTASHMNTAYAAGFRAAAIEASKLVSGRKPELLSGVRPARDRELIGAVMGQDDAALGRDRWDGLSPADLDHVSRLGGEA